MWRNFGENIPVYLGNPLWATEVKGGRWQPEDRTHTSWVWLPRGALDRECCHMGGEGLSQCPAQGVGP